MTIRPAPVWTILVKELRETVRDRRTLMLIVGLPVLLYPLMIIGLSRLQEAQSEASEARRSVVAVWGELPGSLRTALASDTSLTLMDGLGMTDTERQGLETGALSPAPAILIPREERPRGRRVGALGAPAQDMEAAHGFVLGMMAEIELMLRPGTICEEIYRCAADRIQESPYASNFMGLGDSAVRFVGHGVGLELDELPVLAAGASVFWAPLLGIAAVALAIAVGCLASLYPALHAGKLDPTEALRAL